jgi:hypothetical protein
VLHDAPCVSEDKLGESSCFMKYLFTIYPSADMCGNVF